VRTVALLDSFTQDRGMILRNACSDDRTWIDVVECRVQRQALALMLLNIRPEVTIFEPQESNDFRKTRIFTCWNIQGQMSRNKQFSSVSQMLIRHARCVRNNGVEEYRMRRRVAEKVAFEESFRLHLQGNCITDNWKKYYLFTAQACYAVYWEISKNVTTKTCSRFTSLSYVRFSKSLQTYFAFKIKRNKKSHRK
jgi:hypothetical protein